MSDRVLLGALVLGALAASPGCDASSQPTCASPSCAAAPDADGSPAGDAGPPGWSEDDRRELYHLHTGGRIIPYPWFVALEQAETDQAIHADEFVRGFGLVPDPEHPDGLPVGFTRTPTDAGAYVGHNCLACHTEEIDLDGRSVRVDGGSSRGNFFAYLDAIVYSLNVTLASPAKWDRFAIRVLGEGDGLVARSALYADVNAPLAVLNTGLFGLAAFTEVDEGFGRNDAVGRGAIVLSVLLDLTSVPPTAASPVGIPALWNTTRFVWDHHSGAVHAHLARNVAQAVAGNAAFDVDTGESSVPLENLHRIEQAIAELPGPAWPEAFPPIDRARAARGEAIYQQECASCHPSAAGDAPLDLPLVDVAEIGTDPSYALAFTTTTIDGRRLSLSSEALLSEVLQELTSRIIEAGFDQRGFSAGERADYMGGRENRWRAVASYKAIPLTGVWATAPYLHNNSVPDLVELLSPPGERSPAFWVSPAAPFDPERVGFVTAAPSGFRFDTSVPGNANTGHEYGTSLAPGQRADLIEFLKTL
jgi:hypothetical protein